MVMVLRGNTAADLPEKSILHLVIYPIDSLFCSFFSFLFPSSLFSCVSFFFLIVFLLFQSSPLFIFFLTFPFFPPSPPHHQNSHTEKKNPWAVMLAPV
jgi:ABC-type transport system involved in cytochrome bd biosynthesis fused ATPase/permease subunit